MSRSQQSFSKKEREKKKRKKKQEKRERREQRKLEKAETGKLSFEDQISYVDFNGNLVSEPVDPSERKKVKAEDIILGIPPKEDVVEEKVRTGKVKFFNHDKGYGFITDLANQDSIFVHAVNLTVAINENDKVTFETQQGPKGPMAVNVHHYVAPPPKPVEPAKAEEKPAEEKPAEEKTTAEAESKAES